MNTRIPTGFQELDRLLGGGVHDSDLIVIAAVTSMGKTALALSIVNHLLQHSDLGVAYVTLQMSRGDITRWLLSIASGVNPDTHPLTATDIQALEAAAERLGGKPLVVNDQFLETAQQIGTFLGTLPEQHSPALLVVDDMRMMNRQAPSHTNTSRQEMGMVAWELKELARQLGIPVVALVSVSSSLLERVPPTPTLDDLRQVGPIDVFADVVLLLHRDEAYNQQTDRAGQADLLVVKNRHGGGTGLVTCQVDIARHRFYEGA